MSCANENYTITYDDTRKGWTSFHSFYPDYMLGMNNKFFTFKEGNLYIHHSDSVFRNTYYDIQHPSKISLMVNDNPSDIKELQALSLEGNYSWDAIVSAFVGMTDDYIRSSISQVEFVRKEGIWYAFTRRNEDENHFDSKSTYGIGTIQSINGSSVVINGKSDLLTVGDSIIKGSNLSTVGVIENSTITNGNTTLELDSVTGLILGDFVVGMKNPRYEGGNLRGYTMKIDLTVQKSDKVELFAVNSETMKSFT